MNLKVKYIIILLFTTFLLSLFTPFMFAASPEDPIVSVQDITRIDGIRENQLIGYGLVIGLAGTGDSSRSQATIQSISNMLRTFGVEVLPDQVQSKNIAAVIVTAKLPSFVRSGSMIDVMVSSLGDAKSIQGGTLLMTQLRAANGNIYAVAQGPISIGGFNASQGGNQVSEGHPTVGKIPNGALVEREVEIELNNKELYFLLDQPNFETASFIAQAINENFKYICRGEKLASPIDAGEIEVKVPEEYEDNLVEYIANINNLQVRSSMEAKVVINERTGVVVMGHGVRISTVSVALGNLTVNISTSENVSQPEPFSSGETKITEDINIEVIDEEGHMMLIPNRSTISDLVTALNVIGATPREIIALIQEIKAAGALHAKLELI
jgi:flagellar P-ring protein FlgI